MGLIVKNRANMDVLIRCMLCLENVQITGFNKYYLFDENYYTDIEFFCEDLTRKKVDGFIDNGVIRISSHDVEERELASASLLHRIAKLAVVQGYITKDRYEKRFHCVYNDADIYNQVSQELLADILKHIFETQMWTPTSERKPISELIGYTLQRPLKVCIYSANRRELPLKGSYTSQDIEQIQNPLESVDKNQNSEEGLSEEKIERIQEKSSLVKNSLEHLDNCRSQTINRFSKKYDHQLSK